MKYRHLNTLIVLLGLLWAGSALAQNTVILTKDPATGSPMLVAEPGPSAILRFQSLNYMDPTQEGASFLIRFGPEFIGHFTDPSPNTSPNWQDGTGVIFSSESDPACPIQGNPPLPCQVVKIQLDNAGGKSHPQLGYKYEVIMGSKVLDPKVRPR